MTAFDSSLETDPVVQRLAYLVGTLLIVIPFVQVVSQIWPLLLTNIQWRFGAANALSSVLILPFCGFSIVAVTARAGRDKRPLRIIGIVAAIMTAALAVSLIVFILDALQLKSIVPTRGMSQYITGSVRVVLVTIVFITAFSMLTLAAFKKYDDDAPAPQKGVKKAEAGGGLIVGQGYSPTE